MGTGYTRQAAANIVDAASIEADDFNAEFNAIESAFNASTGHSHDGTTGEGPQINLASAVTGTLPAANGGTGETSISALKTTMGLSTADSPQFTAIELGHASDTTIARASAGEITVEGNKVWHAGNDGTGSTLDADTVDGQHASAFAASSHNHAASAITSGNLVHERGGLEADVSAYNGLIKISGGATSQVSDNSSNWDTAYGWGNHASAGYITTSSADSLTNKTIDADNNTISNIGAAEVKADLITGQTELTSPTTGDYFLAYDVSTTSLKKVPYANMPGSGSGTLESLSDVTITSIASGELLKWDGSNWINNTIAEVSPELGALASLTSAANKLPYFSGSGTANVADLSAFGRSIIDDADASAARTTLGLGTAAVAPLVDEDDMASNSATSVPSQQSVKAYVDTTISNSISAVILDEDDFASNSDVDVPTQQSAKAYVDTAVANRVPVPTASTDFPVGSVLLCKAVGINVANGSTTAGTNLRAVVFETLSGAIASGVSLAGTWKNISGVTINTGGTYDTGYWVRTA